jgi:hypothetical protein
MTGHVSVARRYPKIVIFYPLRKSWVNLVDVFKVADEIVMYHLGEI